VACLWGAVSEPTGAGQAQPVPIPEDAGFAPQIQLDGVGAATLGFAKSGAHPDGKAVIDFTDSALVLGAAQRLYDGSAVGSFGLGGVTIEDTVFLHQAFVDVQGQSYELLIGRSDNPTAHVVDFPTLRGDDLVTLTNPLDPFSNGKNSEEHRYADVFSVVFNQGLRFYESFHAQHLIDSASGGSDSSLNSFGASLEYLGSPGMDAFELLPSAGLGYEHLTVSSNASGGIHQLYAGGVLNLNESVTDRIDLRIQDIVSLGSDLRSFSSVTDSFQADSNAVAASLRYLNRPFGRPGYQIALTAGAKSYFKVADARSVGWALTGVKRLGQGFDLVAQVQGQWSGSALAQVQSSGLAYQQTGEVGLIYSFNATFNAHLSPRRTLLNQQHQYIPN
jgi:hypothetical protein